MKRQNVHTYVFLPSNLAGAAEVRVADQDFRHALVAILKQLPVVSVHNNNSNHRPGENTLL